MESTIIQFNSMDEVREFAKKIAEEVFANMRDDSRLLTAKEAAKTLHISVSTLYRMEHRGVINCVDIDGSAKKYRACDIRWLASTPKMKQSLIQ